MTAKLEVERLYTPASQIGQCAEFQGCIQEIRINFADFVFPAF